MLRLCIITCILGYSGTITFKNAYQRKRINNACVLDVFHVKLFLKVFNLKLENFSRIVKKKKIYISTIMSRAQAMNAEDICILES